MLNVHRNSSTLNPSAATGVRNAVIPSASPGLPLVRAKMRSWDAAWMPVFQVFSPLITQSSPSRTAVVSMKVASLPWAGSVIPNAKPPRPSASRSIHSACCSGVPYSIISSRPTLLPTIMCSFCRSQCRPRPLLARCSRMIAMPRLVPSRPPYFLGNA